METLAELRPTEQGGWQVVWRDFIPVQPDEAYEIYAPPAPTQGQAVASGIAHAQRLMRDFTEGKYLMNIDANDPDEDLDDGLEMQLQGDPSQIDVDEWYTIGWAYGERQTAIEDALLDAKEWLQRMERLAKNLQAQ